MRMLGEVESLLLGAVRLLDEDAYGLRIAHLLRASTGLRPTQAQVYVSLDRLQKKGLLASHMTATRPVRGGRSRRVYTLTAGGMTALQEVHSTREKVTALLRAAAMK